MLRARPALLALVLVLPACGHRADPLPPRRRTPPGLGDFLLAQRGDTLEVSCRAPRASVDGVAYKTIDVEVLWAEGASDIEKAGRRRMVKATPGAQVTVALPLPAPGTLVRAAARAVSGGDKGPRTLILALEAQPPLEAPHGLSARVVPGGAALEWQGPRPEAVAPPDLSALGVIAPRLFANAPPGGRRPAETGGAGKRSGERPPTPPAAGPPSPEPSAPEAKKEETGTSSPAAAGRAVPGTAGTSAAAPEEPGGEAAASRSGFHVYRRREGQPYARPLVETPLEGRQFTDKTAPLGATVCYEVRAVASVSPLIESAPSNEACLQVRDIVAPAAPTGLAVLPQEGGLEVVWSPSPEEDLTGYRVYRAVSGGAPARLVEVAAGTTTWLDASAEAGHLYTYSVTAVDRSGNESAPSEAAEGRRP
jgi:hypothetical protein